MASPDLVPRLWEAFNLAGVSQINFDPIVVASYCFVMEGPLTAATSLAEGAVWYPQRSVKNVKGEDARLRRFAEQFPEVFVYDAEGEGSIALQPGAFENVAVHECDEPLFRIALYRIGKTRTEVCEVFDQLEVTAFSYSTSCFLNSDHSLSRTFKGSTCCSRKQSLRSKSPSLRFGKIFKKSRSRTRVMRIPVMRIRVIRRRSMIQRRWSLHRRSQVFRPSSRGSRRPVGLRGYKG